MRAIGYVRVSTEEQARDGVSLAAQREKVRAYCDLYGLELVAVEVDAGVSAKSLDRPGLRAARAALRAGTADGLVVAKLDRLTRSVKDWAVLIDEHFGERAGHQLWSVGDSIDTRTAAGRLVLNVLMSVAQWEREVISERTIDALGHKRGMGELVGTLPHGCRVGADGRTLAPDSEGLAALDAIRHLTAEGRSRRAVAAELTRRGLPTRNGRPWAASTVQRILRRDPAHAVPGPKLPPPPGPGTTRPEHRPPGDDRGPRPDGGRGRPDGGGR